MDNEHVDPVFGPTLDEFGGRPAVDSDPANRIILEQVRAGVSASIAVSHRLSGLIDIDSISRDFEEMIDGVRPTDGGATITRGMMKQLMRVSARKVLSLLGEFEEHD